MAFKRWAVGALVISGALAAVPGYAQQQRWSGFYVGGGIGKSDANMDNAGVTAAVRAFPGVTSAVTTIDDGDTGWKIFAGYQINQNFAVEVGYANLGKFSTFTTTTPFGSVAGEVKVENNWFGDVVGMVPFGHGFYGLGRLGLLYSETKVSASGALPGGVFGIGTKDDDFSWKAGLGVGYDFTPQLGVRGEWERYRVSEGSGGGKADVDLWSVSLRFRF